MAPSQRCHVAAEALEAALKTTTALAPLPLHGELSDASAEALGIALKTSNALTTLRLVGKLSAAARELSVDVAMQRALRQ